MSALHSALGWKRGEDMCVNAVTGPGIRANDEHQLGRWHVRYRLHALQRSIDLQNENLLLHLPVRADADQPVQQEAAHENPERGLYLPLAGERQPTSLTLGMSDLFALSSIPYPIPPPSENDTRKKDEAPYIGLTTMLASPGSTLNGHATYHLFTVKRAIRTGHAAVSKTFKADQPPRRTLYSMRSSFSPEVSSPRIRGQIEKHLPTENPLKRLDSNKRKRLMECSSFDLATSSAFRSQLCGALGLGLFSHCLQKWLGKSETDDGDTISNPSPRLCSIF
ncbi:hypothetical protein B0H34DRAFT_801051 [Crassisporium funariophilum]|nr:hypothetical protein B0H34DRAFT_801051 [Crassisporium funariophilum]